MLDYGNSARVNGNHSPSHRLGRGSVKEPRGVSGATALLFRSRHSIRLRAFQVFHHIQLVRHSGRRKDTDCVSKGRRPGCTCKIQKQKQQEQAEKKGSGDLERKGRGDQRDAKPWEI